MAPDAETAGRTCPRSWSAWRALARESGAATPSSSATRRTWPGCSAAGSTSRRPSTPPASTWSSTCADGRLGSPIVTNAIEAPRLRDIELAGLDADVGRRRLVGQPRAASCRRGCGRQPTGRWRLDAVPVARDLALRRRRPTARQQRLLRDVCGDTRPRRRPLRPAGSRPRRRSTQAAGLLAARAPRARARPDRPARRRRATASTPTATRCPPATPWAPGPCSSPAAAGRPGRQRHPHRLLRAARRRRAGRLPSASSSRAGLPRRHPGRCPAR